MIILFDIHHLASGCNVNVFIYRQNFIFIQEWTIRLDLERSKAIKCPTVHYQLAGTKKIQQELARQGAVERYISDEKEAAKIRSVFAGQFSLDLVSKGDKS